VGCDTIAPQNLWPHNRQRSRAAEKEGRKKAQKAQKAGLVFAPSAPFCGYLIVCC
jgi:hypothetical protein